MELKQSEAKNSEAKNSGTKNSENGIRNLSGLMALMIGMSLTACGSQTTGSSAQPLNTTALSQSGVEYHPSKIIGINPLVPIRADGSNLEAGLRSYIDAFGLVAIGDSGSCSGTHLGNGYVLTAGSEAELPVGTASVYAIAGKTGTVVRVIEVS